MNFIKMKDYYQKGWKYIIIVEHIDFNLIQNKDASL